MKKHILTLAILLIASVAFAQSPAGQGNTVLNGGIPESWGNVAAGAGPNNLGGPGLGRHDLLGPKSQPLGCESCHLPHTAPTYGASFLWAWSNVPSSITTYRTADNPAGVLVTPVNGSRTGNTRSMLCMTCHDGTSAASNAILSGNTATGLPYALINTAAGVGSLGNQHPVDANVPNSAGYVQPFPGVNLPDGANASIGQDQLPLWETKVQCTSCHDQHNDYQSDNGISGGVPFLRVANTNGTYLCRECHNK